MPLPPAPRCFRCPRCGWQQAVYPRSDALHLNQDWFESCPRCHHPQLEQRPLSAMERFIGTRINPLTLFGFRRRKEP